MLWIYLLSVFSFIGGQIFAINFGGGVRVIALDIFVALFNFVALILHYKKINWKQYISIFGPFVGVAIVSLILQLFSLTPFEIGISSLYLFRFVSYSLLTQTIAINKKIREMSLKGLWISGVSIAVLGLVQYFLYPNLRNLSYLGWDPHQYRVFSTFLDPNFTGIVLVLTVILGTVSFLPLRWNLKILKQVQDDEIKPVRNAVWQFGLMGIVLLALLLTYSRGSFVSLIVATIVWGIISKKIKYVIVFGMLFLLSLLLLPKMGGEGVNLLRTISIGARFENSQEAWNLFLQKPLFGWGFDTLRYVRGETNIIEGTTGVSHSGAGFHNSYLFILATTGIVGFGAYLWMWYSLLRNSKHVIPGLTGDLYKLDSRFRGNDKMRKMFVRIFNFSTIAVGVHSLFDNSLFYPFVIYWVWVMYAGTGKEKF